MWAADVVNGDAAVLRIGNGQTRRTFMPPVLVYQIEFANNIDLHPNVDTQDWGDMVLGGSSVGALDRSFDDVGLTLRATRYAELGPTHMPEHDLPSHVVHTTYKLAPGSLPKATGAFQMLFTSSCRLGSCHGRPASPCTSSSIRRPPTRKGQQQHRHCPGQSRSE
jgi:hypothetical protein